MFEGIYRVLNVKRTTVAFTILCYLKTFYFYIVRIIRRLELKVVSIRKQKNGTLLSPNNVIAAKRNKG